MPDHSHNLSHFKAEVPALLAIIAVFALFFWPATFNGQLLIFSDSLVYSYPLRAVAFDMLRHGTLPLWTPAVLSGYPLLSMAQLGLGYPLTWFYLPLPGYWAEQIYVLAPYLLSPIFNYFYLRQIDCSRAASLLGGLSFTYGGMMAGGLAHNGMFTNAVMWLPLMLIAIERSRTGRFGLCLIGVASAYSMSVLTGIGQAFLYVGLIAIAYSIFAGFVLSNGRRWKPVLACFGGMTLAAGVAAFQILETMRAQRRSIRSELSYEVFSGGGFTFTQSLKALIAPYYHLNWEATPYIALLSGILAFAAMIAAFRSPTKHPRTFFWLLIAVFGWLLMMGDHTPLYRLAFHIPLFNRFRLPWRHTFEWSLAVGMLAAFGFDIVRNLFAVKTKTLKQQRWQLWAGLILLIGLIWLAIVWWQVSGLRLAAGEALMKDGESTQYITESQTSWIIFKLAFTALACLTLAWLWRLKDSRWRNAMLAMTVALACCLEAFMLVSVWWFPYARPSNYFRTDSAISQFLKQRLNGNERIYTSAADYSALNKSLAGIHNLSALDGFQNSAGYEPLMLERYNQAFENRWSFFTPWFAAPTDAQLLSPQWRVLDILNARFLIEYSASVGKTIERDGFIFSSRDIALTISPKSTVILSGASGISDSLSIVSNLANSADLVQGSTVGRIKFHLTDGRIIERELKAGIDTAEWAHERPDVKATIKHGLPTVFERLPGDDQNSFPANRYRARIELGESATVDRIEIENVAERASLAINKAALVDSADHRASGLTQRLPDHWRKIYEHDGVLIFENQRVMPRVWLNASAEAVSQDEALRRIRGQSEKSFDPKQFALLEAPTDELSGLTGGELGQNDEAKIINYEPNRLLIETRTTKPVVLVVSEINYPGWEATVDGEQATVYAADYLLRGVILPAGNHKVEMRYTAPAARSGAMISILSLILIAGLWIKSARA
ncbi:MAG: YfhO family protein [Blastocatellales bacterium]